MHISFPLAGPASEAQSLQPFAPVAKPVHAAATLFEHHSLTLARINLCYLWRHRRLPDLVRAPRFTERVQWRKLRDRDPRHPMVMDKIRAKALAGDILGNAWITPTIWSGESLPELPPVTAPFIVKARHGCNQFRVFRTLPSADEWHDMRVLAKRWCAQSYGRWLDEWAYRDLPRGLIIEPLLQAKADLPLDYKVYVFGGQATHIQVHLDRAHSHRWILHDRDWTPLAGHRENVPPPQSLAHMVQAAERLAQGYDFLRVDFYEIEREPVFGEFCLYPGSGLDPFAQDWIDFELGSLWKAAANSMA